MLLPPFSTSSHTPRLGRPRLLPTIPALHLQEQLAAREAEWSGWGEEAERERLLRRHLERQLTEVGTWLCENIFCRQLRVQGQRGNSGRAGSPQLL